MRRECIFLSSMKRMNKVGNFLCFFKYLEHRANLDASYNDTASLSVFSLASSIKALCQAPYHFYEFLPVLLTYYMSINCMCLDIADI